MELVVCPNCGNSVCVPKDGIAVCSNCGSAVSYFTGGD